MATEIAGANKVFLKIPFDGLRKVFCRVFIGPNFIIIPLILTGGAYIGVHLRNSFFKSNSLYDVLGKTKLLTKAYDEVTVTLKREVWFRKGQKLHSILCCRNKFLKMIGVPLIAK
ncbi:hypothetical protein GT360_18205 [Vibrio astriarenae]|uniref:Uncharacterized protein n=1 Tax=Vibrio astriarenae TaxID=1481923 RepID=A0A7Z2T6Y9_9VIBR|nr:hypothetical protein [Vibrio astriarenae]QIA65472.1 hypothetical protein GT360_18205 [Vibrio astriarenae]